MRSNVASSAWMQTPDVTISAPVRPSSAFRLAERRTSASTAARTVSLSPGFANSLR
jgi:hypothetical protein